MPRRHRYSITYAFLLPDLNTRLIYKIVQILRCMTHNIYPIDIELNYPARQLRLDTLRKIWVNNENNRITSRIRICKRIDGGDIVAQMNHVNR